MKKIYAVLFILLLMFSSDTFTYAQDESGRKPSIGDVAGVFQKSNVGMTIYVNGYEARTIPVYEVDDALCICVEDLQYYGYQMIWDEESRTTKLNLSPQKKRTGTTKYIKDRGNFFYSDVRILVDGMEVKGYNMGGYTLVKITDLNNTDHIYLGRKYKEDEQFSVKGKVLLPGGELAPQGDLRGKIVKYQYGYKASPEKLMEIPFIIPENKNYGEYKTTLKPGEFLGYELDDKYGYYNGSLFSEDGRPWEYYRIYTSPLDDYRVNYQNFDVQIFKTVELRGTLTIDGQTPEYPLKNRTVYVLAEDVNGRGEILQSLTVPMSQKKIDYTLPVIADRDYNLKYFATLYSYLPSQYELWVGPAPSLLFSGYYSPQGLVNEKGLAGIIPIGKEDRENVNINIKLLEPVSQGPVIKGDLTTYLHGQEIPSLIVGGEPLVFLSSFNGCGYEMKYYEAKILVRKNPLAVSMNTEQSFDWLQSDKLTAGGNAGFYLGCNPNAVYINGKKTNSYNLYGNIVVLVKDLHEAGLCKITKDSVAQTLKIELLE